LQHPLNPRSIILETAFNKKRMEETKRKIVGILKSLHGIDATKYDAYFLERSIRKRIIETHCATEAVYFNLWENNNKEGEVFFDSLNICYTEFFRNPLTFAVLERIILPSIVLKRGNVKQKEIRIWSAACAAGQEAYSLAMLMEERINEGKDKLNYRIFVTDEMESQVNAAEEGRYAAADLNNLNMKRVNQWFTNNGDTFTVKNDLKKHIDFSVFDLFSDQLSCPSASIFGDFDLVICANILFYYKPEYQKKILKKMSDSLAHGGYLVTGETERDIILKQNYIEVFPQSAIFQRLER